MRIQFIFPNFDCPLGISIGVAYLSAALKQAGHDTRIIHIADGLDYPFEPDRILSDVRTYGPDLVAFSSGDNHFREMTSLAKLLKDRLGVPVLFGGIHTTLNMAAVMERNPWIDFANVGEGDESVLDLASAMGFGDVTDNIPNVWARTNGVVVRNASRPLKDITNLPWMDLDGWQFERITSNRRGWVNISMNRGCPYRCTYCHNNGVAEVLRDNFGTKTSSNEDIGYLRLRGIDDMLGELKDILGRWKGVKAFSFIDDTFTMNQEHAKNFLVRYKEEIGLPLICNTTVMDVDREMLEAMKDAGCDLVRFGVETASIRIRKRILQRNFSDQKVKEAFRICEQIGLRSFAFNILANPTETRQEMLDTVHLNARIRPDGIRIALGYPYPGTKYHAIAQELRVIDENIHLHNYLEGSKFRWSADDRLFIDKLRSFYWWWMNADLNNAGSPLYRDMVRQIEAMSAQEWEVPETRRKLREMEAAASEKMARRRITHYTVPFGERPDIAILERFGEGFLEEYLDEH